MEPVSVSASKDAAAAYAAAYGSILVCLSNKWVRVITRWPA